MSDRHETSPGHGDDRLSQAYRDLARERAPGALNDVVLDAARRRSAGRRASGLRWLPPVALAAAVCLSLAIVLETTRQPDGFSTRNGLPAAPPADNDLQHSADDSRAAEAAAIHEAAGRRAAGNQKLSAPPMAPACDDSTRLAPDTWLACIESLESRGLVEDADRERGELTTAFPEFVPPGD